ncbi:MAG: prolipoprotein diacylglyceryl transferase [Phycisphaerales bacterium]|nr:prolipoprotein diacylglyceryl transferase [Phycisphaerales bacterium]
MYPNLFYAFKDLFHVEIEGLKIFNTFGFFVALAFMMGAYVLASDLRRKQLAGLLQPTTEKIIVGKPASFLDLLGHFFIGYLLGLKIVGAFLQQDIFANPQDYMFSWQGSVRGGLLLGIIFAFLRWKEKDKAKLSKPEERTIHIWPADRVGDITMYCIIFGFLGAKLFDNFEHWDAFIANPIDALISFSGLAFYGGLICATFAVYFYCRSYKVRFIDVCDSAGLGLMLAYAIGRIGCQMSGDGDWGIINSAYISNDGGKAVLATNFTQVQDTIQHYGAYYLQEFGSLSSIRHLTVEGISMLPKWMVAYTYPHNVIDAGIPFLSSVGPYNHYLPLPVFPTPFYETVICLILFILLFSIRKKLRFPGQMFGLYLIVNGIERFIIEKIRINIPYSIAGFNFSQAQIIAICLIVLGCFIYLCALGKFKKIVDLTHI